MSDLPLALDERLCRLAHELNNGLAIIAGQCELLADHTEAESECAKRLRVVLDMAHRLAARINSYECGLVRGRGQDQNKWPDPVDKPNGKLHSAH